MNDKEQSNKKHFEEIEKIVKKKIASFKEYLESQPDLRAKLGGGLDKFKKDFKDMGINAEVHAVRSSDMKIGLMVAKELRKMFKILKLGKQEGKRNVNNIKISLPLSNFEGKKVQIQIDLVTSENLFVEPYKPAIFNGSIFQENLN